MNERPIDIYLAAPYQHEDHAVEVARFEAVSKKAAELMNEGKLVLSPLSHAHPMKELASLPSGWDYWERLDTAFLSVCKELHILCIQGWASSKGVQEETKIADSMGIPVVYHESE